ncbi:MerR family transcriptional regulator [Kurthia populi]|uniref:MerR family transcriptional regulator n=1 Tax=Kurthia populi TaxID=1562132 RepID=A0ABW5XYX4_9BACL|nr:MerR family transcriptional regulator [Candidatus Kurthia intestinigallinarum]
MHDSLEHFTIADVSAITGIKKDTLRKWEERYDFLKPMRLSNSYRRYSNHQVAFLYTLSKKMSGGLSLKKAIDATNKVICMENDSKHSSHSFFFKLLAYGAQCNEEKFSYTLHQAHQQCGLVTYLQEIVQPFLKEVGNRWATKQWAEYQEKFSSTLLQHHLIELSHQIPVPSNAKLVMGACLPNEQHELPLHILLLQIQLKGARIFLIGQSPAPGTIEDFVEEFKPRVVLLSATTRLPLEDIAYLKQLDEFANKHPATHFFIGGEGAASSSISPKTIQIAQSLETIWPHIL